MMYVCTCFAFAAKVHCAVTGTANNLLHLYIRPQHGKDCPLLLASSWSYDVL